MKALIYRGLGKRAGEDKPRPTIPDSLLVWLNGGRTVADGRCDKRRVYVSSSDACYAEYSAW